MTVITVMQFRFRNDKTSPAHSPLGWQLHQIFGSTFTKREHANMPLLYFGVSSFVPVSRHQKMQLLPGKSIGKQTDFSGALIPPERKCLTKHWAAVEWFSRDETIPGSLTSTGTPGPCPPSPFRIRSHSDVHLTFSLPYMTEISVVIRQWT